MGAIIVDYSSLLINLEKKVEDGIKSHFIMGQALDAIKGPKLYLQTHDTWEQYTSQRFAFTPQYANLLIQGYRTLVRIQESETKVSVLPQSETQTRVLAKAEDPASIWLETQKRTESIQPTAKAIRETLSEAFGDDMDEEQYIDAEVVESFDQDDYSLIQPLLSVLESPIEHVPFSKKHQMNVSVDDISFQRLDQLRIALECTKAEVITKGLMILEKLQEMTVPEKIHEL